VSARVEAAFAWIVRRRGPILVAYALALAAAVWLAVGIRSDAGISGLIVPSDPDFVATRAFEKIFPERPIVILLLEADDPWSPDVLRETAALEAALRAIPGVSPYSALDVYRRTHPGFRPTADGAAAYRAFATGTSFFRRQGLVGDRFQGLAVGLDAETPERRDALLEAVDAAIGGVPRDGVREIRRIGAPYVEAWIERASREASVRWFPVFGLFVVGFVLFLYRSWRTLAAIVLALGTAVALGVAVGRLLGFSFTVVSALVPLTVMVTALANLVYVQSRFVDQPEGVDLEAHRLFALRNKLLPVSASTLAAVLGFAALAVSKIRPIREMGLWTAAGLALSWLVVFTLFPALQKALRTPTGRAVAVRTRLYDRVAAALPELTWRHRRVLVPGALVLAAAGLVALAGVPGRLAPMRVGVDSLDYVDPSLPIHRDMLYYRAQVGGLNVARLWVTTPPGAVTDPEVLRGLDAFAREVEREPDVTSVVGPSTFLRMRRYLATGDERLPDDPAAFAALAGDVEQLLLSEPELRAFVDAGSLSNAQLTVLFRGLGDADFGALQAALRADWERAAAAVPALRGATMRVVGTSMLQAKVGASLVPTLAESFAITAVLIFVVFLFVFRSASARLMAMIPSVFAILVTFLGMRLTGTPLNVATILIATTVLGTTENDQIHFFHHLNEGEGKGLDVALRHALRVSGRAIVFATLINAAGFLGLSFSSFPPLRQFGVVTAAAFLLAMIADFSALPAALWIARRESPRAAPTQPIEAERRSTTRR
jgi:predicted RND superfamily exporter protein